MDPPLHANLGRAAIPCFASATRNLFQRKIISFAAEMIMRASFRKRTEAALECADVRVVDVAVDHVANNIAASTPAQFVSTGAYLFGRFSARRKQSDHLVDRQSVAADRLPQHVRSGPHRLRRSLMFEGYDR